MFSSGRIDPVNSIFRLLKTGVGVKKIVWKTVRCAGIAICWMWLIGFLAIFLCWILGWAGIGGASDQLRFPLGLPGGIAVDDKGYIYCSLSPYHRVQVYDKGGRFIRGWFVLLASGGNYVELGSEGNIHVRTVYHEQKWAVFTPYGKFIGRHNRNLRDEGASLLPEANDKDGNIYRVRNPWTFTKIVKIIPSDEETVVVSDPFYLWFVKAPFPSAAGIFGISAIYGVLEFWKKKKSKGKVTADATPTN